MDISKKIGRKVAALRNEQGWSQSTLGSKVGLDQKKISRIENGSSQAIEDLDAIAEVLGLDGVEELISLAREIPDLDAAAS